MAELTSTSPTAADATFSASGTTAWNAGMTANSGQLTPARGGTGADTSASSGIAHVSGGTWTVSAVVEADLTLADNTTANVSTTAHGFAPKITDTTKFLKGDGTWATPSGGAALSGITAATGAASIESGDNDIEWEWAQTTDSTIAFSIFESAAATGGTITSGVPNQVLCRLGTLAGSTSSPLAVYSRGTHVFSVSPTANAQIRAGATGSSNVPIYSFAARTGDGFDSDGSGAVILGGGSVVAYFRSTSVIINSAILQPIDTTVKLGASNNGWAKLFLDYTNTATVGNVTINKPSGRVNLAAAGTTLTLTNSVITAASHVFLNSDGAPGNVVAVQLYAVPAAGSCTINAVPAVTNQTAIDFVVVNAD